MSVIPNKVSGYLNKVSDRRTRVRRRLEQVFGRDVIGAVAVTSSVMKVVENLLNSNYVLSAEWVGVAIVFTLSFIHWERIADKADSAVEKAADTAEKVSKDKDNDD